METVEYRKYEVEDMVDLQISNLKGHLLTDSFGNTKGHIFLKQIRSKDLRSDSLAKYMYLIHNPNFKESDLEEHKEGGLL